MQNLAKVPKPSQGWGQAHFVQTGSQSQIKQFKDRRRLPYAERSVEIYTQLRSPDLAGAQETLAEIRAVIQ